jgi:hypothetical protein
MKAYGMNPKNNVPHPDRMDDTDAGRCIKPSAKARVRRSQKRAARQLGKALCADRS